MYKLYFNGFPIHNPQSDVLRIREPDAHLAVNEPGELSFVIDSDHPNIGQLKRLNGVLELKASGVTIYKGRIRKDTQGFYLSREIESEGLLACLNDSVIPPHAFPDDFLEDPAYIAASETGNVVQFYLNWLLTQHNAQVTGAHQKINLGDVTVTDPNNYIHRESGDYLTTMEAVEKKLVDLMGGYLLADYSGETTVLHYYADLPLTNVQEVEFGENLLDLKAELDSLDTYTAILPTGSEGLTIADLPDGQISPGIYKLGKIIYSQEAEELTNSRIIRREKWDDVTQAENLQSKASAKLTSEGVKTLRTISVKAADLGGSDISRFMVGRYVRLKSAPHGYADTYPLMELDPDILDPGNTRITIGEKVLTSTDIAHKNQNATQEEQDKIQIEMNKQEQEIEQTKESVLTQITEVIQTCEQIIFSAMESYVETGDFEEFKQTIQSELSILADEISLRFEQTTEQLTEVDGDLQKTVETLSKYFDFNLDGLTIHAGEGSMSLRLDNDLIIFERNGQQFGWWDGVNFHTGNIVINVNERAQFGTFAFVPRSNGSLSFLKVSGTGTMDDGSDDSTDVGGDDTGGSGGDTGGGDTGGDTGSTLTIITQPAAETITTVGSTVTLSVVASGTGLKYLWHYATSADGSYGAMSNQTSSTLTLNPGQQMTRYYRCRITDANGKVTYSAVAKVIVNAK
jgi:hypothetical protein